MAREPTPSENTTSRRTSGYSPNERRDMRDGRPVYRCAHAGYEEVDTITFEVIKHRLWQINDEQSIAIRTISSSPIVVEGNDFNVGLFSEDGQVVTAGIGSLVHVGTIGDALRSIMRGAPHIRHGDVLLPKHPLFVAS